MEMNMNVPSTSTAATTTTPSELVEGVLVTPNARLDDDAYALDVTNQKIDDDDSHHAILEEEEFGLPQQQNDYDDDGDTDTDSQKCVVKQTIAAMEESQLCFHPVHYHSFAPVSFLWWGSMRKCVGCNERLKTLIGGSTTTAAPAGGGGRGDGVHNDQVVRCVSCGAFAHRSCAATCSQPEDFARMWENNKCPVNNVLVEKMNHQEATSQITIDEEQDEEVFVIAQAGKDKPEQADDDPDVIITDGNERTGSSSSSKSLLQILSPSNLQDEVLVTTTTEEGNEPETRDDDENDVGITTTDNEAQQTASSSSSSPPSSLFQFLSPSNFFSSGASRDGRNEDLHHEAPIQVSVSSDEEEEEDDEEIMLWTSDGPPRHWANEQALSNIPCFRTSPNLDDVQKEEERPVGIIVDHHQDDDEQQRAKTPLQVDDHTFATVSRAIQENIIAHFIRRPFIERVLSQDNNDDNDPNEQHDGRHKLQGDHQQAPPPPTLQDAERQIIERTLSTESSSVSQVDVETLLAQVEASTPKQTSSITKVASSTRDAAKATVAMRKKMGVVTVVGGAVGGVLGLAVAGPAGAVIGAKCGQTAGLLGLLLEGSMTVGVVVAGVAAGSITATHIQEQQQKRVLTIGEDGVKQKLLLVRPHVSIDPEWEAICRKARRSHAATHRPFSLLSSPHGTMTKKERLKRDSDIVETDESEIATAEKVFLLVSRSLNDKESMPGHVYKCLIQEYREREKLPRPEITDMDDGEGSETSTEGAEAQDERVIVTHETECQVPSEVTCETKALIAKSNQGTGCSQEAANAVCSRRRDAHAVIKHVTATLLEARPGFAASPAITEMSATSVEALVFGEVYDSVFGEVAGETRECDDLLMRKIRAFDQAHELAYPDGGTKTAERGYFNEIISQPAVGALLMLTEAHSAVDKLRYCVKFLEMISIHFTETSKKFSDGKPSSLSADSLLKMVCQHIIAAKVPNVNAEILFLEEFARDEQLLRGKEGYALVTLQASLHFLNTSTNFDEDIFGQDDVVD